MLIRTLVATAFATVSLIGAASAGTITNGVWTPTTCGSDPGPAPVMNGKDQKTYSASAKEFQAWQDKAKAYVTCVSAEAKTDQSAIVDTANKTVTAVNEGSQKFVADANDAMERLKKKGGK
jgi:hypothetical protein